MSESERVSEAFMLADYEMTATAQRVSVCNDGDCVEISVGDMTVTMGLYDAKLFMGRLADAVKGAESEHQAIVERYGKSE